MQHVLITRTDRLGDVILSLPVAAAIKAAQPQTRVTFLVAGHVEPVVGLCPWVDDCMTLSSESDPRSLVADLRKKQFDATICLYPRPALAILCSKDQPKAAGRPPQSKSRKS